MELVHGDQLPIAVSGGNLEAIDRGRFSIGLVRRVRYEGDNSGHDHNAKQTQQKETDPFHVAPPIELCMTHRLG
jgi:hypothetical protein